MHMLCIYDVSSNVNHSQVRVGRGYARAYNQCSLVMRTHEDHAQNALDSGSVSSITFFYVLIRLSVGGFWCQRVLLHIT